MPKRPSLTCRLQSLDEIGTRTETAPNMPSRPKEELQQSDAVEHQTDSLPRNTEQRESRHDSVTARQCHEMILSNSKSQEIQPTGSRRDSVTAGPCSTQTEQSHGVTVSRDDSVISRQISTIFRAGVLKPKDHYCAVPNVLIQQAGLFENTFDFAVYLHLFGKSYGFGRNTCDMGLSELEEFTGLARNSVKKCIDRLIAGKWIKMLSDYEYGRVTRKWRVFSPYEKGQTPHPTFYNSEAEKTAATVSKRDTVTTRLCHDMTPTRSPGATVTGSPRDIYKESKKDNFKNNSLSKNGKIEFPQPLQEYLSSQMPQRKRERELKALADLQKDYSLEDITDCVQQVLEVGLPGGEACHSPLGYLAFSMREVLKTVRGAREIKQRRAKDLEQRQAAEKQRANEEVSEQQEWAIKERAFNQAFPSGDRQHEVISELCSEMPYRKDGPIARNLAISAWWNSLSGQEKLELYA